MPARTLPRKKSVPLTQPSGRYPVFLIVFTFLLGFFTHLLFSVIFAETKDGKIMACVKENGDVRIRQKNEGNCKGNETALEWNIQGPPGPAGSSSDDQLPFICASCDINDSVEDLLSGKNLTNAVLYQASLDGANLSRVNFTNANLSNSSLVNTNFSQANLENANLRNAQTDGTNWEGVTWKNTTCPNGSNSDQNGNTCIGLMQTE